MTDGATMTGGATLAGVVATDHAASASREPRRRSPFAALWTAAALSYCGDGVILAAAPLAAASLTSDPRLISGLTVASTLPWALFCLVSGAVVDRVDRIRLMWRIDLLRAAMIAAPAATFLLGAPNIVVLYVAFFGLGTAETFFVNAAQAALPSLVPASALQVANGRLQSAELVLSQLAGPPLGGLLFAVAAGLPFAIDAASFLLSAVLLLTIRQPERTAVASSAERVRLRRQIAAGLGWLWRHRQLRGLALLTGLTNLSTEATLSVLVIFTRDDLGLGTIGFGDLLAVAALGGVIASFVGPSVVRLLGETTTLVAVMAVQSATQLVIFCSSSVIAVGSALAMAAFGIVVWNIVTVSLRQAIVPDHLLGRVNSVYRLVAWGTLPIGAAAGGVIAALVGTRALFLVSGLLLGGATLLAVILVRTPYLPRHRYQRIPAHRAMSHPESATR